MFAKLYSCNICKEPAAEGIELTFIFEKDIERFFVCKSCSEKTIKRNSFLLRFLPHNIKRLLKKYGLYD